MEISRGCITAGWFILFIMAVTRPYSLWNLKFTCEWQNQSCQTNTSPEHIKPQPQTQTIEMNFEKLLGQQVFRSAIVIRLSIRAFFCISCVTYTFF